jgi:aminomethyltransferase
MTRNTELRQTPLDHIHRELGAKMVPFAGFEMPIQYTGIIEEHRAVRKAAGMFDVSHMGEVIVTGPQALAYVQHLVTNDATKLVDGKAMYTVMCRPDGGIVDDLLVYQFAEDRFMLVINASNIEKDIAWMRENLIDGAELEDVSDETALIALQGPKALEIFEAAFGHDVADLRFYHFFRQPELGDARDVIVSHTGYTGETGLELYCSPSDAPGLWNALMAAGKERGLLPCGLGARDTLRIEAGFCLYGNDITEETNPLEAGLGWLVKLDKGSFIGSDALARVKESGPDRKLVGFVMEERGIPRAEQALADEHGSEMGIVTSGTQSPLLEKGVGLGYVQNKPEFTTPGSALKVAGRGRMLSARVAKPPFHKN